MRLSLSLAIVLCAATSAAATEPNRDAARPLLFERDVRPILKAQCFHCHGEEAELEGKLDLRFVRTMLSGGDSGPALVPGKADHSLILERITAGEMPPGKKKLSAQEIATIRMWVEQGAQIARSEPELNSADHHFTQEERDFWSFQPIREPSLPPVQQTERLRSPIDAFLLAELERFNLSFSAEADRRTLIRRLAFDLLGLPPHPQDVEDYVADSSPDAHERMIERFLSSPHYGERWGRHWLDVAGYADSDGYAEQDPERKYAFKYRDYVVSAFNRDKPWDEFIVEQLAGDELLAPPYANLTSDHAEKLTATGFLRMGPDGTGVGGVDQNVARNEVIAETIKIVSSSLLGLSVGCAQCHNHRYDPITQVDYYRFRAIFEPAYDWKNWRVPAARQISLWTDAERAKATEVDSHLKALAEERTKALNAIVQEVFERELAKLPDDQREAARAAREAPAKDRTPEQQRILKEHPSLNVNGGSVYLYERKRVDDHNKHYNDRQAELQAQRPPENFVPCLTEIPGKIPATQLFFRGDFNQPRQEVDPGELSVLCASSEAVVPKDDPTVPTSGRRLALARHLTSGRHPLVARVLVNRFWHHHFGRGLVSTPSDFGVLGSRPSHPELLDWLASEFMSSGWSLKHLHRIILNSAAYRQVARRSAAQDAIDPENRLLGRMNVRRLEAEVLRDAILATSAALSIEMSGPPVPVTPDEVGQVVVGVDTRDSAGRPTGKVVDLGPDEFRRSVYIQVRRTLPLSMLETFDAPDMRPNCELRNSSTVSPQSLLLMNNEFVMEQSEEFASHLQAVAGDDLVAQVRLAWQLAFARQPAEAQIQAAVAFLNAQSADLTAVKPPASSKKPDVPAATRALASYCQALLSSNRFLYVD